MDFGQNNFQSSGFELLLLLCCVSYILFLKTTPVKIAFVLLKILQNISPESNSDNSCNF